MTHFNNWRFNRILRILSKLNAQQLCSSGVIIIMGDVNKHNLSIKGDGRILKKLAINLLEEKDFKELIAEAKAEYLINRKPDINDIIIQEL